MAKYQLASGPTAQLGFQAKSATEWIAKGKYDPLFVNHMVPPHELHATLRVLRSLMRIWHSVTTLNIHI
jgi:hypothetical protein